MIAQDSALYARARPPNRLERFLRSYPGWASFVALAVGDLVLLGWLFDIQVLKSLVPGFIGMNPLTALALAFAGLSLWLLRDQRRDARELRLGRAFAVAIACIGGLRLFGYLVGWEGGIDTILHADKLEIPTGGWRNRMAPNTALAFGILGASLALLDVKTRRGRPSSEPLALGVVLLSLFAVIGYAYDADSLYGPSGRVEMAAVSAAVLFALGFGVLCARPDDGFVALLTSDTPGGSVKRRLMPAVLVIPVVLGWLRLMGEKADYFDTSTGTALFAIATVVVLATLVHRSAVRFDRSDRERRLADGRTREAQTFLDSIVENVPNMVFVKEATDLRFVRINKAGEDLLGFTRDELIGKNDFDFFPREEAEFFTAKDRVTLTAGALVDIPDEPIQTRHNGTRYLHTKKVAITDADGKAAFLLGISEDITEQKAADAELRRNRAVFESLFESLPGPYLVLTPDLRIVTANAAYLEATMTTREDLRGRDIFDAFPDNPGDPAATGTANLRASLDRVRRTLAADTMAIQKYDVRDPDGRFVERFWSPINSPVLGADGKLEYILHRVEDVTEFVRQKSPAARGTAELQTRMEQMEAEVFRSSQQVQTASRQLEAANKELESFSYSVSHDLRAPLRHINGFADLLVQHSASELDATSRRYLDKIRDSAKRMGILIDELLQFSKMSRKEVQSSRVSVRSIAEQVLADLHDDTRDRAIEWRLGSLPEVDADPSMLRQVLANLIGNAVKYTGKAPQAVIEIGSIEAEAHEVVIFVRDNGVGFDMQYADKLFGVFQRLHGEEEFEGTGIGLANVRRIIERHGGRTWAEGRVDRGAIFYFSLPIREEVRACAS
jgi:PAS domain S-box-containing protein